MTDDYLHRFSGLARLYGRDALERLHAAHVAVVGVGGVGSWAVEALARSGIGRLTLIDLDDVCLTNVNRQLPASEGAIGRPKVEVLAERVRAINPGCTVDARAEFFLPATADRLLDADFGIVVDAIDGTTAKAHVIGSCVRAGRQCVTTGGAGGKRDGTQVRIGDLGESWGDNLLRLVRQKLRAVLRLHQRIEKRVEVVALAGPFGIEHPGTRNVFVLFRLFAHHRLAVHGTCRIRWPAGNGARCGGGPVTGGGSKPARPRSCQHAMTEAV